MDNSILSQSLISDSQSPVCHLIRGVLGGLMAGLFGVTVQAREIACLAHGDPVCRFEIEAGE
jgi:predicted hydrocarbon binding protein